MAVLAPFVVLLAAGTFLTWCAAPVGNTSRGVTDPRALRVAEVLVAALVTAIAFVWLRPVENPLPLGNFVFVTIVDCLLFGQCYTLGPGSSVLLNNGAVWPEIELVTRSLGGSPAAVQTVVVAMLALGVGVICLVTARFARPAAAVPAATLALAALKTASLAAPLLDTSVTFLFFTGASAALLVYGLTARPLALVTGAVLAAHALGTHASGVSILPAFVFVPALATPAPTTSSGVPHALRAVGFAVAGFVLATLATSAQTLTGNWWAAAGAGLLPYGALGIVALAAGGIILRPRYQRLGPVHRALVVGACLVGPYGGGVVYLGIIHHAVLPGYLPPLIAPGALAVTLLLAALVRRTLPPRWHYWGGFALPMLVGLALLGLDRVPTGGRPTGLDDLWARHTAVPHGSPRTQVPRV